MSEVEREESNPDQLSPELAEFEASLSELVPADTLNRDELLFEAGRRAARPMTSNRFWKCLSAALTVMLAVQTGLFWMPDGETVADADPPETPVGEPVVPEVPGEIPEMLVEQVEDTVPVEAQYLRIRRLALARGVDAVYSPPADAADSETDADPDQRVLLRELLGS